MKQITWILGILLLVSGPALAQSAERADSNECAALLDQAKVLEKTHGGTPKIDRALAAYDRAFARCGAVQDPSPATAARVAAARGDVLFVYHQDRQGAIRVLENGLKAVTAALGEDAAERVALLDELSNIYGSNASTGLSESPGADRVRSREMAEEALRVRQAAYGARSLKAAEGWVLLAAEEGLYQPELAEKYARQALEIAREHGDGVNPQTFHALAMLAETLRSLGRLSEAEAVDEETGEVIRELEASGQSLDA